MLKILQARLQQYVNWEFPHIQAGFRKGRRTRDQTATICWIIEKAREIQKNIYFSFIDCAEIKSLWLCGSQQTGKCLWEYQTTLSASCETCMQVKKQQLELSMNNGLVQIEKGVFQGCIFSPWLFNFYAEYIMRNAGLDDSQAGIKIAWRNINNLRYANDSTLMTETEEDIKSLLMKVKEESKKAGLKQHSKN